MAAISDARLSNIAVRMNKLEDVSQKLQAGFDSATQRAADAGHVQVVAHLENRSAQLNGRIENAVNRMEDRYTAIEMRADVKGVTYDTNGFVAPVDERKMSAVVRLENAQEHVGSMFDGLISDIEGSYAQRVAIAEASDRTKIAEQISDRGSQVVDAVQSVADKVDANLSNIIDSVLPGSGNPYAASTDKPVTFSGTA